MAANLEVNWSDHAESEKKNIRLALIRRHVSAIYKILIEEITLRKTECNSPRALAIH